MRILRELTPRSPVTQQGAIWQEALATAQGLTNDQARALALGDLAPHLSDELLHQALESARAIADDQARALALGVLASHLHIKQQVSVWQEALDAVRGIVDDSARSQALAALAPHLPTPVLPQVLDLIWGIKLDIFGEQATVLGALAPHLPGNLLPQAVMIAQGIKDTSRRAEALRALAPHLAAHGVSIPVDHWHTTIRLSAVNGRPKLLSDLAALMPWLTALAPPEELAAVGQAVVDVARCWP